MLDVERAVLGCLIQDPTLLAVSESNKVTSKSFSVAANGVIYEAIRHLVSEDHPVDLVSLHANLTNSGDIERCGGSGYVASMSDDLPYTGNFGHYVDVLRDEHIRREILDGLGAIHSAEDLSGKELLAFSEALIGKIGDESYTSGFVKAESIVNNIVLKMEDGDITAFGIPTGFEALDRTINGLHKGNLVIIAARPGDGKSALALNIMKNAALAGYTAAGISIEMDKEELGFRLLSDFAELPTEFLKGGKFGEVGWKNIAKQRAAIAKLPLFIEDKGNITIPELMSNARRMKAKGSLDLLVVDYLQLMDSGFNKHSRNEEVGTITRYLKKLAKSLDIPVIALSQLNRKVEDRIDRRPVLSDLRESGSIEQDSDIVMFINQSDFSPEQGGIPRDAEIIIAKNRNGRVGSVWLTFEPTLTRFTNRRKVDDSSNGAA